jgi:hypothetical protein
MGSITAIGLADTTLDLETQLKYHLQGNHYPPIPTIMVQPCIEAIDAAYDEDWDRKINLPCDGVDKDGEPFQITWKGNTWTTASMLIEHAHLQWFIEPADEDLYE